MRPLIVLQRVQLLGPFVDGHEVSITSKPNHLRTERVLTNPVEGSILASHEYDLEILVENLDYFNGAGLIH